jgi:hypothetical protein
LQSSIRLLKLLDEKSPLVQDYIWAEKNLGNLVPMEVVLTVPPEKRRSAGERADESGDRLVNQYRMTMLERLQMVRKVVAHVERLPAVSRTLSVATFAPTESTAESASVRRAEDYNTNESLEDRRESFRDYLQMELDAAGEIEPDSRELWRISARVTALQDIDYGQFTAALSQEVEPVLLAYRQSRR